jgi:hypothetical protein
LVNTYSNVLTFVQEQVVQGTPNIRDKLWRLTRDHFAFHSISTIALNGSSALNNPLLKELLATGYVYRTALGLRALLIGKRNDDISIEKVLIFLKKHRYCITRNEVLLHQGLPFEGDDLEMEARDAISQATKKRSGWIERSRYQDWLDVQKRFDNISQVQPKIRSPNDTISDIWINTVDLKRCAALDLIKEFTDKSIAHVTTRSSSIPYSHFDQALELTWSAFNDIGNYHLDKARLA